MGNINTVNFVTKKSLSRRQALKSTGAFLALPILDAMTPAFAKEKAMVPRRMIGICNNLGLLSDKFFPKEGDVGKNYQTTPYLKIIEKHRKDFTVFSGVSHPNVDGGHPADVSFLTAAPAPGGGGFKNTVSIDQYIGEKIGIHTRFPSFSLGVNARPGTGISYTNSGVLIPCQNNPVAVYEQMFTQGTPAQIKKQINRLKVGGSIMDAIAQQSKSFSHGLGFKDKDRLDQYYTGVRDLEKQLAIQIEWENKPKPKTNAKKPQLIDSRNKFFEKANLMYDMASLAFETDSTRSISISMDSVGTPPIYLKGVNISDGYHNLSHHGRKKGKLAQLEALDTEHMKSINRFLNSLASKKEGSDSLLDRTMVLYGSNLGDANTHVNTNMPIIFAGGGFKHGQHLGFSRKNNYPLSNIFVSILHRMGIEVDEYSTGKGPMKGLEMI